MCVPGERWLACVWKRCLTDFEKSNLAKSNHKALGLLCLPNVLMSGWVPAGSLFSLPGNGTVGPNSTNTSNGSNGTK